MTQAEADYIARKVHDLMAVAAVSSNPLLDAQVAGVVLTAAEEWEVEHEQRDTAD